MISYGELFEFCDKIGCRYSDSAYMSSYTSFRIGGKADAMIFPDDEKKLSSVISFVNNSGLRFLVIGKGSNMLVSDSGFRGVVINTCELDGVELLDETTIKCKCGTSLAKLCRFALDNSLAGLEFAFGIPGSVGGAVFMNAGAYGGEIKDVILSAEHFTPDGELVSVPAEKLGLSYRHSIYSGSDNIIVSAVFKLRKGDKDEIKAKMDEFMGRRRDKQPLEYPSAGSTFKRPEGYFAGALIEQCGLKGYSSGGAQVSEKHAGFVINKGGASAEDVMSVIRHCQKTVLEKTGVTLETEVMIIE